jgi:hypothetical protein
MTSPHDTGVTWPYNDPTPAMINIELWLFAEFCYWQYEDHTKSMAHIEAQLNEIQTAIQTMQPADSLTPANLTRLNQAVTDLQGLQTQPPA